MISKVSNNCDIDKGDCFVDKENNQVNKNYKPKIDEEKVVESLIEELSKRR